MQVSPSGPVLPTQGCHVNLSEERINYLSVTPCIDAEYEATSKSQCHETTICFQFSCTSYFSPFSGTQSPGTISAVEVELHTMNTTTSQAHPRFHCIPYFNMPVQVSKPAPSRGKSFCVSEKKLQSHVAKNMVIEEPRTQTTDHFPHSLSRAVVAWSSSEQILMTAFFAFPHIQTLRNEGLPWIPGTQNHTWHLVIVNQQLPKE